MTLYNDRMQSHLAMYKRERLGIQEDGIYRNNERAYAHILPEALKRLNILETIRREFWQYFAAHSALLGRHAGFHHLKSSQAFAFNLLFPLVAEGGAPDALLAALGIHGKSLDSWSLEHMPDQYEQTSFDFYAVLSGGSKLLVEVKLTEASFGAGVNDAARQSKRTYLPRLQGKVHEESLEEATFFLNYQLFRNVSHLDLERGDTLILLLPRANEPTWAQGIAFRENYCATHTQGSVRVVALEDLVQSLLASPYVTPRLRVHLELLIEKYALGPIARRI